jgi:hypothetical protein
MTLDIPEQEEYFWSALQAFASRTCYANTCARTRMPAVQAGARRFKEAAPKTTDNNTYF